jgi:hypothetical protein
MHDEEGEDLRDFLGSLDESLDTTISTNASNALHCSAAATWKSLRMPSDTCASTAAARSYLAAMLEEAVHIAGGGGVGGGGGWGEAYCWMVLSTRSRTLPMLTKVFWYSWVMT